MLIYRPTSVFLPIDYAVERIYRKSPTPKMGIELDTKTIFYDLYLNRNTNHLCGIGPALHNLKEEIFPLEIYIGKTRIDFFITKVKKLIFLESKKPISDTSDIKSLTLKFKTFECLVELNNDERSRWPEYKDNNQLTLTSLQKDNPVVWIEDWILWHCRLYEVKRVILYDNGSYNRKELITKLRKLEPEVSIILVFWGFPFGRYSYEYAQRGSLNHCRMRFTPVDKEDGSKNWYCINVDIDEYLVSPHCKNLFEYIETSLNSTQLYSVVAKSVGVPNILPAQFESNRTLRFFDFKYQYRNQNKSVGAHANTLKLSNDKYIFRFGSLIYNDVHRIIPNPHGLNFIEIILLYLRRFPTKISRHLWRLKRYLRIRSADLTKPQYHSVCASESDLYYLHFVGLVCKWNDRNERSADRYSEDRHIELKMIGDLARQANLTSSSN